MDIAMRLEPWITMEGWIYVYLAWISAKIVKMVPPVSIHKLILLE